MGTVYRFNESRSISDGASPSNDETLLSANDTDALLEMRNEVQELLREYDEHQNSDTSRKSDDTESMSDVTMDQIDKKLSGIENRMDKRVERIERETDRRSAEFRREIEIRDAAFKSEQALRDKSLDERFSAFFSAQAERDRTQLERDKRYELLADRVTKAAEGAEEAAKQAATVKSNYWAAVAVQLLAVVAIIVGAYFANQANVISAISTTVSVFQAGKDQGKAPEPPPPASKAN